MILDLDKGFVFLKSTKSAGTSIEIWLSCFCGPRSVITPTLDEDLRRAYHGRAPSNFRVGASALHFDAEPVHFDIPPWGAVYFFNHMRLDQLISQIGVSRFAELYSFGFTRDPFERALSSYTWLASCNPKYYTALTFPEHRAHFRAMIEQSFESTQKWLVSEAHQLEVTRVFRFEEFDAARAEISRTLQLDDDQSTPLPRAKSGFSGLLGFPRAELIDDETKSMIERVCDWELSRFYPG